MLVNLNYDEIKLLLERLRSLNPQDTETLMKLIMEADPLYNVSQREWITVNEPLFSFLSFSKELSFLIAGSEHHQISSEMFIVLDCWKTCLIDTRHHYDEVKSQISNIRLVQSYHILKDRVQAIACMVSLFLSPVRWSDFTAEMDTKNWRDILLLSVVLPLSGASLHDGRNWLSSVIASNPGDVGLNGVASNVYQWLKRRNVVVDEIDSGLEVWCADTQVNIMSAPYLKALQEIKGGTIQQYFERLDPLMDASNAYNLLYGLGSIGFTTPVEREYYRRLMQDKFDSGLITKKEFILLGSYYTMKDDFIYDVVETSIITTSDTDEFSACISYVSHDNIKHDEAWLNLANGKIFMNDNSEFKKMLAYYLSEIAEKDISLAYTLLESRMATIGLKEMLSDAVTDMIHKDKSLFQQKFASWLLSEDRNILLGMHAIGTLQQAQMALAEMPASIFSKAGNRDKVYAACKSVGFIYAVEPLVGIFLAVVESVDNDNDLLEGQLEELLEEYVVYNYRGALQQIRKRLQEKAITEPARRIFQNVVDYFDNYFQGLRSISVTREIRPYDQQVLFRSFFMRRRFKDLPKEAREKSFVAKYLKNSIINADKWAIKRPGELKHRVQSLGRISTTMEFPSGENLNPIRQEYFRHFHQRIKKDEIDTD